MKAPPRNLQDLKKSLLLTAWCQITQDTIGGLADFTPQWVQGCFGNKKGTQLNIRTVAINVQADWCI